jgi:hypothetical protein
VLVAVITGEEAVVQEVTGHTTLQILVVVEEVSLMEV